MTKIIGLISAKGGAGKTTVTANLGSALSSKFGKKVVAIDLNVTTSHLGITLGMPAPPFTLNDVLKGQSFKQATLVHNSGLYVVPASVNLKDIVDVNVDNLSQMIRQEFVDKDFVLLDSAPGLGKEAVLTIQASDEIIFVATPHVPSIVDVIKSKELIETMGKKVSGLILNRVKNKSYELTDAAIIQGTGLQIIQKIPEDDNVLMSTNSGIPVVMSNPNSPASVSFYNLAASLAGVPYQQKISFLHKLLSMMRIRRG